MVDIELRLAMALLYEETLRVEICFFRRRQRGATGGRSKKDDETPRNSEFSKFFLTSAALF
jgi:hypothetical protein